MKIFPIKKNIKKILKDLKVEESFILNYNQKKEIKNVIITKISDKQYTISKNTPYNWKISEKEAEEKNYTFTLTEIFNYVDFTSKFYINVNDKEKINLEEKFHFSIDKSSKKLKKEKEFIENYNTIMNFIKGFHKRFIEMEEEKVEKDTVGFSDSEKTKYSLKLFSLNNNFIWDCIYDNLLYFGFYVERLSTRSFRLYFNGINYVFGEVLIHDGELNLIEIDYKFNRSCYTAFHYRFNNLNEEDYKKTTTFFGFKIKSNKKNTNLSKFLEDNGKYSSSNFSLIRNNKYSKLKLEDYFFHMLKDLIEDNKNIDLVKLGLMKVKNDWDKDKVVYVVDNEKKPTVNILKEYIHTIIGEYYCSFERKYVKAEWNKKDGKFITGTYFNLLTYPFREYTVENFDWSILPKDTNMLFRRRDTDTWDSSDKYSLSYNVIKGDWSNTIDQNFDLGIDRKYNFTITNIPKDFKFKKKVFESSNEQEMRFKYKKGLCDCGCGSYRTKPLNWNGTFQGFYCDKSYTEQVYYRLD